MPRSLIGLRGIFCFHKLKSHQGVNLEGDSAICPAAAVNTLWTVVKKLRSIALSGC